MRSQDSTLHYNASRGRNLKIIALSSSNGLICWKGKTADMREYRVHCVSHHLSVVYERLQTSGAVKLYLFDVFTKLAIAADSAPDDSLQFHVCSDVIDIAVDVGTICWSVIQNCRLSTY